MLGIGRVFTNLGRPSAIIVGRIELSPSSGGAVTGVVSAFARQQRAMSSYSYETLSVTKAGPFVTHVMLNRPDKRNAMNKVFWR